MKYGKAVMEQWKIAVDERCKKDLREVVERITEELYTQAKIGNNRIPHVGVYTDETVENRPDIVKIRLDSDNNYDYIVIWKDFVSALNSLCYHVDEGSNWHNITPDPL